MAFHILSRAGAFSPGADLWVLPDLDKSQWTRRIDWYLNFQLSKMKNYKTFALSEVLSNVLADNKMDIVSESSGPGCPLLVSSEQRLPNLLTVELPFNDDLIEWGHRLDSIWTNLKSPSLRIFLPQDMTEAELRDSWPHFESLKIVSVVPAVPIDSRSGLQL